MTAMLGDLVSGDELRLANTQRAKRVDEKTIIAASVKALQMKREAEEEDGWELAKANKRSLRMKRAKPEDRQLEDDVWSLFYRMGFKEMNASRNFMVIGKDGSSRRQLDVFAKDDETVFIVECTHSRENAAKSIKGLLDKIEAVREDVIAAVRGKYGRDSKLKVKLAIATRNVDVRNADRERASAANVPIITEADLDYFRQLTGILKKAARYQFLGRYLRDEKVEGLRTSLPATRGRVGDTTFYSFLISPHDLLRTAYISHRSRTSNDDIGSYQRMVKPARLKAIGAFIDEGGTFPTNIVVNIKRDDLRFDSKDKFGETATGMLHLPGQYGCAWVVDGQHRLYGYAYAGREADEDRSVVSVLAYENLPALAEIKMFVDINTQQVKVRSSLVKELISDLDIEDDDPRKRLEAICARAVLNLGSDNASPLNKRILFTGDEKTNWKCLSLASLVDGLKGNNLVGSVQKPSGRNGEPVLQPGPLGHLSAKALDSMRKAQRTLQLYFSLFAEGAAEHWELGDAKGGYLCTNLGLRALLVLMRNVIRFIEKDGTRVVSIAPEELVELIEPYVGPVIQFFTRASASEIAYFRNRGSSLASVDQNAMQMMAIVASARSDFNLPEIKQYLDSQDAAGTEQAREMILKIHKVLYDDVVATLKSHYGEVRDAWWITGVPKQVRIDCDVRYNNEGDTLRDRWQSLNLIDYSQIVVYEGNWDLFKDRYNFYGKGAKAKLARWIGRISRLRNITTHVEKGPLSRDQVQYVRDVYALVMRHIAGGEPVDGKVQLLFDEPSEQGEAA
ncbi:DGQHR domain-containing protein [Rhizobium laguerreae]|uniref:DGQHR domain-containing protein n=1 Tax=Rhizobium laguerreae TaxID=1076926 RepID=UPI001C8FF849|nr:DGQHR domain-containing protein [Rhizobium laguerreae]MBY3090184.1 DGQHR domain-containing protein [Rhizobium laguerreae]